jgi:3-deoxy-manno-octulosonate cytidylyltransferase (CMP-KDO synthetase)
MVIAVIPCRMSSTRFYGKPLARIAGQYMVKRVFLAMRDCPWVDLAVVAAEDQVIVDKLAESWIPAVKTPPVATGSDRVYELVKRMGVQRGVILNVQGDEPLIRSWHVRELLSIFDDDPSVGVATLVYRMPYVEAKSSDVVKVSFDGGMRIFNLSRVLPPTNTYYAQVGIMGFRADRLAEFGSLEQSYWEKHEGIELLRFLDNKIPVHCVVTKRPTIGVDRLDDIKRVEEQL